MIPDGEKLLSKYLRDEISNSRFVGKTPEDIEDSWVLVTLLDAPSELHPDHFVGFYFQLDAYAGRKGGQPEANLLGRRIRAALEGFSGVYADGVVSGAKINGYSRIPDTDVDEPARERIVITTTVWAHP